jgi:dihydrofolate reductase
LSHFPNELNNKQSNKLLERLRDPAFYNLYHNTSGSLTQGMVQKKEDDLINKIEEEQYIQEGKDFVQEIQQGLFDKQLIEEIEAEYSKGRDFSDILNTENLQVENIASLERIEDIILNTPRQEMSEALSSLELVLQNRPSFQQKIKAKTAKTFKESLD